MQVLQRPASHRLVLGTASTGHGPFLCTRLHCRPPVARRARQCPASSVAAMPVPAAPQAVPAAAEPECSPPAGTFQKVASSGAAKALLTPSRTFGLAIIAGAFIAFGALFALSVGCACPAVASNNPGLQRLVLGVFGLPLGLILVMGTGVELFTGNTMFMACAATQGLASVQQLAKNWVFSFLGNLVGSFGVVWLMGFTGLTIQSSAAVAVATTKTSLAFSEAFTRAIFANWLVNLAIWLGTSSSSLPGKILGAIVPVTAFTAMGMEHSVANMSLIPMGMTAANVTMQQLWVKNLIPVVLGNIVGGAVCMGLAMSWAHGEPKAGSSK